MVAQPAHAEVNTKTPIIKISGKHSKKIPSTKTQTKTLKKKTKKNEKRAFSSVFHFKLIKGMIAEVLSF